jgi:hypothetical protein
LGIIGDKASGRTEDPHAPNDALHQLPSTLPEVRHGNASASLVDVDLNQKVFFVQFDPG